MDLFITLLVILALYNIFFSFFNIKETIEGFETKNIDAIPYLFENLVNWNNGITIAVILLFVGARISKKNREKQEEERTKLEEEYENNKLEQERIKKEKEQKRAEKEEQERIEKINLEKKKIEREQKSLLKEIGYLDSGISLESAFILIKKFGIKREFFKPNDDLNSNDIVKKVEAVKDEELLNKTINSFNEFYDIEKDNEKFINFIKVNLEDYLFNCAKNGDYFPFGFNPFYEKFYSSSRTDGFHSSLHNLNSIFTNLHLIGTREDPDTIDIKIFELYFESHEFSKLKKQYKDKGITLSWANYSSRLKGISSFCENHFCVLKIDKFVKEEKQKIKKETNHSVNVEKDNKEIQISLEKDNLNDEKISYEGLLENITQKKVKQKKDIEIERKEQEKQNKKDKEAQLTNFKKVKPDLEKIYNKFKDKYFKNITEIKLTENLFRFTVVESGFVESSEITYRFFATKDGYSYTRSGWVTHYNPITSEIDEFASDNNISDTYKLENKDKVIETIMEVFEREISPDEWPS